MNNNNNIFIKSFIFFTFFISSIFFINAIEIQVKINETSTLTDLNVGSYSLVTEGILELYNPSNVSRVYEFNIPLKIDSLVGMSKLDYDNTSQRFNFKFNSIHGYFIEPNETIKTKYRIFGLLNYNIFEETNSRKISILEYYSSPMEFSSNINLFLQKPQREGFEYDLNGSLTNTPGSNLTSRLISAGIRNPTDFSLFAKELKVYKTSIADPFFKNGDILKTFNNYSIDSFSKEIVDLFDYNSSEDSVYWVSSNFVINYFLDSNYNNIFNKKSSASTSKGGDLILPNSDNKIFLDSILLKKSVDKTVVKIGDEVKVYLRIVNVNNFAVENLTIFDSIPEGYEIKDVSTSVKINSGELTFNIDKVGNYETYVITYTLKNKNDLNGITYLKPAQLNFKSEDIFSDGVLLINGLLAEEKIFVQKEIVYVDSKYAKVVIKVKNLGSIKVEEILISDNLDENSSVKEISKVFFKRGSWIIKSLSPGEEWQVSYLIERNANLNSLPNVYGIDKTKVFGSLVSSEEIITIFQEPPKAIEKVGMAFAVGLLVLYLLF